MAVVVRAALLPVQAQRLEHRPVLDREEDGGVARRQVGVLVERPRRAPVVPPRVLADPFSLKPPHRSML